MIHQHSSSTTTTTTPSSTTSFWGDKYHPRTYVVHRSPYSLLDQIDGNVLNKSIWMNPAIPWSDNFNDIRGTLQDGDSQPDDMIIPPAKTVFKALYDDTHLYIAAVVYPLENNTIFMPTEVHYTQRNSPIFQLDSDYEIFIDPIGSCHNYKEYEMNAINTVWNLMLNRPYMDGGCEHSARIAKKDEKLYYDVQYQKSAVQVVNGIFNDIEHGRGALWTTEIALSYKDLYYNIKPPPPLLSAPVRPQPGTFWRVNFSRVEWKGKINWTWQRQLRWDPIKKTYHGYVDMHLPESWGYFVFADKDNANKDKKEEASNTPPPPSQQYADHTYPDISWPARWIAATLYYAQHHYKDMNGGLFTCEIKDLILPDEILLPPLQADRFIIDIETNTYANKINDDDDNDDGDDSNTNDACGGSLSSSSSNDERTTQTKQQNPWFHINVTDTYEDLIVCITNERFMKETKIINSSSAEKTNNIIK